MSTANIILQILWPDIWKLWVISIQLWLYLQIYLQDYRSRAPASPAVTLETFFVVVH